MELRAIVANLRSPAAAVSPMKAEQVVPDEPGLYSIFVDAPASLPEPFRSHLQSRDPT